MRMMTKPESQGMQTLDKSLAVLSCFTPARPEWGVTELAAALGLPKSAVHKILSSFGHWGLVAQDRQTKRYRLGLKVLELGQAVSQSRELREAAEPQMESLASATGETVVLRIADGEEALWLDVRESPAQMRMTGGIGRRTPLYAGASNLVLMAALLRDRVEQIVQRHAPEDHLSRRDFAAYSAHLKRIRERGYAISTGEVEPGVTAVAAAVRDFSGQVVASLSVAGPAYRLPSERIPGIIVLVCEAAAGVSRRLGALT